MPLVLSGSTGIVSANIADGTVAAGDLASSLDLTGKTITLPSGVGGKLAKAQVFNVTPSNAISTSGSSFIDFVNITYTPAKTTSSIIIFQNVQFRAEKTGADARYSMRMTVDGSTVYTLTEWGIYDYGGSGVWYNLNWPQLYVHSNTTGNNINIKIQGHCDGRANSLVMYGTDSTQGRSHIQVMEIAV